MCEMPWMPDLVWSMQGVHSILHTPLPFKCRQHSSMLTDCDTCAGIILNNQMDDFSTPDQTNTYGLPPSQANFIRPFKKPQSSMSPMIVTTTDGRLRAALGASGGPRIISSVIQTLFRCALRFAHDKARDMHQSVLYPYH